MAEPVDIWHGDHARFSALLDFLERQLSGFRSGGDPDYVLMRDVVQYLRDFADRFHHPREDAAFARLVASEPALELPINRLLQEHREIDVAGQALLARLEEVLEDVMTGRERLEAALDNYLVRYRHHIAMEEERVLPRAAQLLTVADWKAVAAAVPEHDDPLFGPSPKERYRELSAQIASVA